MGLQTHPIPIIETRALQLGVVQRKRGRHQVERRPSRRTRAADIARVLGDFRLDQHHGQVFTLPRESRPVFDQDGGRVVPRTGGAHLLSMGRELPPTREDFPRHETSTLHRNYPAR
jgi:hypothetical protein